MRKPPSYRRQRRKSGTDLAFVALGGVKRYLGPWGSAASRQRYAALLAEFGEGLVLPRAKNATINQLVDSWITYLEAQDVRNGSPKGTPELRNVKTALRMLCGMYGATEARAFGPVALEALRGKMIADHDWCRGYVNRQVGRVGKLFRWAARKQLVPSSVPDSLAMLDGLRAGGGIREAPPIMPVADDRVDATLKHLSATVAAMIEVLRLTGMRPGEVCRMRTTDIDRSGTVWTYSPSTHKMAWRGRKRAIHMGPRAQEVLRRFLGKSVGGFVFSPRRAEEERRDALHAARVVPMSCGSRPGSNRKRHPKIQPGESYTAASLAKAVNRACDAAFPPPAGLEGDKLKAWRRDHRWSPGQLRHSVGTKIRAQYGVEAAGSILGHTRLSATEIYSEVDANRAAAIMQEVG